MRPVLRKPALVTAVLVLGLALGASPVALVGCGDDTASPTGGAASGQPKAPPKPAGGPPVAGADAGAGDAGDAGVDAAPSPTANMPPLPNKEFQEQDFIETDRNRDPFRTYTDLFVAQAKGRMNLQRQVLVDRYALDELKLMGIVTRAPARVLLADPTGLGWVAKVGDFIGKSEIVHAGGPAGSDVAVNWRIDRIRDEDVVFIREDPSHPEIAPTTRVISLHPVDEASERGVR